MTDLKRSGQVLPSEASARAAGTDPAPLWKIALPSFACAVALGVYLIMTIGSSLL